MSAIHFDLDYIVELANKYAYDVKGVNVNLQNELEYWLDYSGRVESQYPVGTSMRVFNVIHSSAEKAAKELKNVSKADVAYIAAYYGFIFGMGHALEILDRESK